MAGPDEAILEPGEGNGGPQPGIPPLPETRRSRRRRALPMDAQVVVRSVLRRVEAIANDLDRSEWMERRLQRYAKLRGWLEPKTYPWNDAANTHVTLIQEGSLRIEAGLFNATQATRPLMQAKSLHRVDADREDRITKTIDAQLFGEVPHFRQLLDDWISAFVEDGTAVVFCPWVRDQRRVVLTKFIPPAPAGVTDENLWISLQVARLLGAVAVETLDGDGLRYRAIGPDQERRTRLRDYKVEVFDTDGDDLEVEIRYDAEIFDGPVPRLLELEDVLVPTRVANLQPPADWNPLGAPYVFLRQVIRLDTVKRLMESGQWNRLDAQGFDAIVAAVRAGAPAMPSASSSALQEQRDDLEGREHRPVEAEREEEYGALSGTFFLCFDRWPISGQVTDVQWIINADAKRLCDARRLTDLYPSERPRRPLATNWFIRVKNRFYGISYPELMESIYDLVKTLLDQNFDAGTLSNLPFFFYSMSSAFPVDTVRLAPGEGYPVPGDPRAGVYFPALPTKDQTWSFNMMGFLLQMAERLRGFSDLQVGRVPTGKASALRTVGTTVALLQQADVRADQILLRFLDGLRELWTIVHHLNRHFLPATREFRLAGPVEPGQEAYLDVTREELDIDAEFAFEASFLNSNAAVLAQTMTELLGVLISPFLLQAGIVTPEHAYRLVRDFIKARKQDPDRYVIPPGGATGPRLSVEDVIALLQAGHPLPLGTQPLESPAEAVKKAMAYLQSDQFGLLPPATVPLFRQYLDSLGQQVRQAQLAQAALLFQQQMMQGGSGGGVPSVMAPPETTGAPAAAIAMGGEFGAEA